MHGVLRLDRIILICESPVTLAHFYEQAFGFTCAGEHRLAADVCGELLALPGAMAHVVTLRLGKQRVDLVRIEPAGRAYPDSVPGPSALFQHFAIEVTDLAGAWAKLRAVPSWTAISVGGPQTLPATSGGVTAFKFRDPEGHPLELITPPPQAAVAAAPRITHSAISVQSTERSIEFYARLGLARSGGSLNLGPEQERLDAVGGARVAVTALTANAADALHLELLCYGKQFERPASAAKANDIAATWLVFALRSESDLRLLLRRIAAPVEPTRFADGALRALVRDPDGHWLCLEVPVDNAQPPVANPG